MEYHGMGAKKVHRIKLPDDMTMKICFIAIPVNFSEIIMADG